MQIGAPWRAYLLNQAVNKKGVTKIGTFSSFPFLLHDSGYVGSFIYSLWAVEDVR